MRDRDWQIGLFGTFDVENYGDLLFPLIAEAELTERLGAVNIDTFSYHAKTPPDWPYTVTSLAELPYMIGDLDGVLIGGGFLIRFDKEVAPGYGPPTPIHHPTGYWLTPALIALQHGIPVIWNAPGAVGMDRNKIPAWADPLIRLALSLSLYVAVRDDLSKALLARFADESQIEVVPDTAFGISRLLDGGPSSEFKRLCDTSGLNRPYIIIQAAQGFDFFSRFVKKHAHRLQEFGFLALPIGPALGDNTQILDIDLPFVRLPVWPHPLLLAELISQSVAVIGHSYHLAITALASGVPVFTPMELSVGRLSGLGGFENIFHLAKDSELDLDWFLERLRKTVSYSAVNEARDRLAQHWDRVAEVVRSGVTATQPVVNRFWQSLPGLLETAQTRCEAAVKKSEVQTADLQRQVDEHTAALVAAEAQAAGLQRQVEGQTAALVASEARAADLQLQINDQCAAIMALGAHRAQEKSRIDELNELLALARTEIVARDDTVARLRNSPSWKVTAPLRFMMRNLKRLAGK